MNSAQGASGWRKPPEKPPLGRYVFLPGNTFDAYCSQFDSYIIFNHGECENVKEIFL